MTSSAKVLQFPLAGIARDMDFRKAYVPSEDAAFASPFAVNVMGECALANRMRGGSRPGLVEIPAGQPSVPLNGKWLWPNGEAILWPNGDKVAFCDFDTMAELPGGGKIVTQHGARTIYRARLVKADGTLWMASRTGDYGDFDCGATMEDEARAACGNVALADIKGETITAMAAIQDTRLVIATQRQIRVLTGEPTTGAFTTASEHVGIVSANAWCFDGTYFWFVGTNGLYAMQFGAAPICVSKRLPEDFKGITYATLVYDPERNGIHIFGYKMITRIDWYYDIAEKAFWKMEYPSAIQPTAGYTGISSSVNRVVFLCADGVFRVLSDSATTDNGTPIASKVAIGPLRTSKRDDMDGMLAELNATIAEGSSSVRCDIYEAHSPEAAVAAASTGGATQFCTFSAGWNNVVRTRTRGAWVVLVLSATGRWGYESMTAICKMLGRLR